MGVKVITKEKNLIKLWRLEQRVSRISRQFHSLANEEIMAMHPFMLQMICLWSSVLGNNTETKKEEAAVTREQGQWLIHSTGYK